MYVCTYPTCSSRGTAMALLLSKEWYCGSSDRTLDGLFMHGSTIYLQELIQFPNIMRNFSGYNMTD
jgi:hypothetical protein